MASSENVLERGREIFKKMVTVETNVGIYPPKHPAVLSPAAEICDLLGPLFAGRKNISFAIVNSEIYFDNHLLSEESIRHSDFIRLLSERGVNNLSFDPAVTPEAITVFFSFVSLKGESEAKGKSLKNLLKGAGVAGISFEELVSFNIAEEVYELNEETETVSAAQSSYEGALDCMEAMEQDILADKAIDTESLNTAVSALMGDFLTDRDAITGLLSIKDYNKHLFHHSVNVALTCLLMANKLGLPEDIVRTVGVSGMLHDIGKLNIPPEILDKPERLTDEEWAIMKTHPVEGARMLMRYENLGELPVLAAMEHHAHYDMSGYPALEGRTKPHAIARIIAVADVYEAMTANRAYRPACSVHQAISVLMSGVGTQFDPLLLKHLLNIVGVFPPGSFVRLRTGQTAVVVEATEGSPFHPKVRPLDPTTGVPSEIMLINTADDPVRHAVVGIADSPKS